MKPIALSVISFDAGTQVRAAINESVVAEYAERMTEGVTFPPIVLFHDGSQYYLADGFHRVMAAKRNDWREMDADVHAGTKTDALWFALGANKTNGQRMTTADKRHAIELAVKTWGDAKSSTQIAEQMGIAQQRVSEVRIALRRDAEVTGIGNLPDRVIGKDGKSYPASRAKNDERAEAIRRDLQAGGTVQAVAKTHRVHSREVGRIAREMGRFDKSRDGVSDRYDRMRVLAASGHSSRQIAAMVGLTEEGCRAALKKLDVEVPADRLMRNQKRHDANRIVDSIVTDAENLMSGSELIEFGDLNADRLGGWIDSLIRSKKALSQFISRLMKEQNKHGQAA